MAIAISPTPWPAKDPEEQLVVGFDFAPDLATGETVVAQAVAITTRSGTDASPAAVLDGAASRSGAVVSQAVQAGTDGVSYLIRCAATTSMDRVLVLAGVLPVRTIK